jgi:hypothetical protein
MVIRVDVPSLPPVVSLAPIKDAQFSPEARAALNADSAREEEPESSSRGHVSSVMPTAAAQQSALPVPQAPTPTVIPSKVPETVAHSPTPVSMLPESEGPQISVGVLSMPHLRPEPVVDSPTPAPLLIPLGLAPVVDTVHAHTLPSMLAATPVALPEPVASPEVVSSSSAADVTQPDEGSGVRYVHLKNEPGVLREVCSPVLYNRCS